MNDSSYIRLFYIYIIVINDDSSMLFLQFLYGKSSNIRLFQLKNELLQSNRTEEMNFSSYIRLFYIYNRYKRQLKYVIFTIFIWN